MNLSPEQQDFISKLSPTCRRLAEHLVIHGSSHTHQLSYLEISNISEAAKIINMRAEQAQVACKVVCRRKSAKTTYGRSFIGHWEICF